MEAFVYCWTDYGTNRLYVGVHKGTPDDGYVCSSKPMVEEYTKRPNDFSRQIIAQGTFADCYALETAVLKSARVDKDPAFYNRSLNHGPFRCVGKQLPEHIEKRAKIWRGKKRTEENIVNYKAAMKIHYEGSEWRERISAAKLGKKLSHQHCLAIKIGHRKQPMMTCPHCEKIGGKAGMKVHHFNNCKRRNDLAQL